MNEARTWAAASAQSKIQKVVLSVFVGSPEATLSHEFFALQRAAKQQENLCASL